MSLLITGLFIFSLQAAEISYDKNTILYLYAVDKAITFLKSDSYAWLGNYRKYVEYGIQIPVTLDTLNPEMQERFGQIDYYGNPENLYLYLSISGDVQRVPISNIVEEEYQNLVTALQVGNKLLASVYIGTLSRYIITPALWPYYMGKRSILGSAVPSAAEEYFNELAALMESQQRYKLDTKVSFDKYLNHDFDIKRELAKRYARVALPSRETPGVAVLYDNLLLSNPSLGIITADKSIPVLSGDSVGYKDWEDTYLSYTASNLSLFINFLAEVLDSVPDLNRKPLPYIREFRSQARETHVNLTWLLSEYSPEIAAQVLYMSEDGVNWNEVERLDNRADRYTVSSLTPGIKYFFKLVLVDIAGEKSGGDIIAVIPTDRKPPSPPSRLLATPGNNEVFLEWQQSPSPDVEKYVIYVYSKDGLLRNDEISRDQTQFLVDTLPNDQPYSFKVSALDKFPNESLAARAAAIPHDGMAPEPVTGLRVSGKSGTVKVAWTLSVDSERDAVSQRLCLFENNVLIRQESLPPASTEKTFTGLKNDNIYAATLRVSDEAGNWSDTVSADYKLRYDGPVFYPDKQFRLAASGYPYFYDLNNDHYLDMVCPVDGKLALVLNREGNGYAVTATGLPVQNIQQLFVADLNRDQNPVIVVNDEGTLHMWRKAKGDMYEDIAPRTTIYLNKKFQYLTTFDYNNDRFPDLVTVTVDGELKLYENRREFQFFDVSAKMNLGGHIFGKFVMACDFDNDFNEELVVINQPHLASKMNIYKRSNLTEKYSNVNDLYKSLVIPRQIGAAAYLDYNNDKKIDLVFCLSTPNGLEDSVLLFKNTGSDFVPANIETGLHVKDEYISLTVGDFNVDGKQDIFLVARDNACVLLENRKNLFVDRSKENGVALFTLKNKRSAVFADNDNDGDPDLFVFSQKGLARYFNFRNTGEFLKILLTEDIAGAHVEVYNQLYRDEVEFRQLNRGVFPGFQQPVDLYFRARIFNQHDIYYFGSPGYRKVLQGQRPGKIEL